MSKKKKKVKQSYITFDIETYKSIILTGRKTTMNIETYMKTCESAVVIERLDRVRALQIYSSEEAFTKLKPLFEYFESKPNEFTTSRQKFAVVIEVSPIYDLKVFTESFISDIRDLGFNVKLLNLRGQDLEVE